MNYVWEISSCFVFYRFITATPSPGLTTKAGVLIRDLGNNIFLIYRIYNFMVISRIINKIRV